jgi:hypothetical protein
MIHFVLVNAPLLTVNLPRGFGQRVNTKIGGIIAKCTWQVIYERY